jgi:hypothetical protein
MGATLGVGLKMNVLPRSIFCNILNKPVFYSSKLYDSINF